MRPVDLPSLLVASALGVTATEAASHALTGWNDLGMHCTDGSDFSVFSILPHYNTIHGQLVRDGRLVTVPGVNWRSYAGEPMVNGGDLEVTLQPVSPASFFRLSKGL